MTEMDDIFKVHPNLYIGAYWPRINFKKLEREGITAIVNLMEDNLYTPPRNKFAYLHKGFPDDTYPPHEFIKTILDFIDEHSKKGNVLVHCAMGISRSGGLIIAWLLKQNPDWSWKDALNYVWKSKKVFPAPEIRDSILDYLEKIENKRRKIN